MGGCGGMTPFLYCGIAYLGNNEKGGEQAFLTATSVSMSE